VRDRRQELVLEPARLLGCGPRLLGPREQPGSILLGALSLGDVVEEDADLTVLRPPESEGEDVEVASELLRPLLEAARLPRPGHLAVDLEPVLLMRRGDLAHPAAFGGLDPRLPLEGGVDPEEAIIFRALVLAKQHLEDAEAFVDRLEERAVLSLAGAQRRLGR
jgi:hypothetical protein